MAVGIFDNTNESLQLLLQAKAQKDEKRLKERELDIQESGQRVGTFANTLNAFANVGKVGADIFKSTVLDPRAATTAHDRAKELVGIGIGAEKEKRADEFAQEQAMAFINANLINARDQAKWANDLKMFYLGTASEEQLMRVKAQLDLFNALETGKAETANTITIDAERNRLAMIRDKAQAELEANQIAMTFANQLTLQGREFAQADKTQQANAVQAIKLFLLGYEADAKKLAMQAGFDLEKIKATGVQTRMNIAAQGTEDRATQAAAAQEQRKTLELEYGYKGDLIEKQGTVDERVARVNSALRQIEMQFGHDLGIKMFDHQAEFTTRLEKMKHTFAVEMAGVNEAVQMNLLGKQAQIATDKARLDHDLEVLTLAVKQGHLLEAQAAQFKHQIEVQRRQIEAEERAQAAQIQAAKDAAEAQRTWASGESDKQIKAAADNLAAQLGSDWRLAKLGADTQKAIATQKVTADVMLARELNAANLLNSREERRAAVDAANRKHAQTLELMAREHGFNVEILTQTQDFEWKQGEANRSVTLQTNREAIAGRLQEANIQSETAIRIANDRAAADERLQNALIEANKAESLEGRLQQIKMAQINHANDLAKIAEKFSIDMSLLEATQTFEAAQAEADRTFRSGEAVKAREFEGGHRDKDRAADLEKNAANIQGRLEEAGISANTAMGVAKLRAEADMALQDALIAANKAENGAQRAHAIAMARQAHEDALDKIAAQFDVDYKMLMAEQTFTAAQAEANRAFSASEAEKNRAFTREENAEERAARIQMSTAELRNRLEVAGLNAKNASEIADKTIASNERMQRAELEWERAKERSTDARLIAQFAMQKELAQQAHNNLLAQIKEKFGYDMSMFTATKDWEREKLDLMHKHKIVELKEETLGEKEITRLRGEVEKEVNEASLNLSGAQQKELLNMKIAAEQAQAKLTFEHDQWKTKYVEGEITARQWEAIQADFKKQTAQIEADKERYKAEIEAQKSLQAERLKFQGEEGDLDRRHQLAVVGKQIEGEIKGILTQGQVNSQLAAEGGQIRAQLLRAENELAIVLERKKHGLISAEAVRAFEREKELRQIDMNDWVKKLDLTTAQQEKLKGILSADVKYTADASVKASAADNVTAEKVARINADAQRAGSPGRDRDAVQYSSPALVVSEFEQFVPAQYRNNPREYWKHVARSIKSTHPSQFMDGVQKAAFEDALRNGKLTEADLVDAPPPAPAPAKKPTEGVPGTTPTPGTAIDARTGKQIADPQAEIQDQVGTGTTQQLVMSGTGLQSLFSKKPGGGQAYTPQTGDGVQNLKTNPMTGKGFDPIAAEANQAARGVGTPVKAKSGEPVKAPVPPRTAEESAIDNLSPSQLNQIKRQYSITLPNGMRINYDMVKARFKATGKEF